jgi:ribonucleoside-diphosphate reductase alpha chain
MPEDEVGLSGWGFCNLSTINGKTITSEEDFYERCAAAAFIGTLQASFTSFPYLGRVTELIARKEALLGVSINGMQHHPKILLSPEIQQKGAEIVKSINKKYASILNISPAARTTCIKPEGNSSALLGSTSGIHPDHSRRYFRIVQANQMEAPYRYFKSVNPQACEESVWSSNKTDDCIRFCVQSQDGTVLKEHVSAISMLEDVISTYSNWVITGKNEDLCVRKELNHNVSNTIHVQDNEWDLVKDYIYKNKANLAGVSLIASSGDKDYNQAPFTAVYSIDEQIKMYGFEATSKAYELYPKFSEYEFDSLWNACSCNLGYFEPIGKKQEEWKKLIEAYSCEFFNSNIKYATYALKDASNLDLWNKLIDSYSPVNYLDIKEETSTIDMQGELACAGGACLV